MILSQLITFSILVYQKRFDYFGATLGLHLEICVCSDIRAVHAYDHTGSTLITHTPHYVPFVGVLTNTSIQYEEVLLSFQEMKSK